MDQQHLIQKDPSLLNFKNVSSLISYIYYLTSNDTSSCPYGGDFSELDYDSKELLNVHKGKSVLKIDKYLSCCIPGSDLEFILESQGIMEYSAYLDPEYNFKHGICNNEGVISEIFTPDIQGDHYNPYIRFKSCCSSAYRSLRLVLDLVGLEIKDLDQEVQHDNIFLDIVCTFPPNIDRFLMNPGYRSVLLDRMNKCRKIFFNRLNEVFFVPVGNSLGLSSSLHVWGSEIPVLPHAHIHNIVPFFSYKKKVVRDPEFFDNLTLGLDSIAEYYSPIFMEVDITHRNSNKRFESHQSFISNKKLNNTKTKIVESDNKIIQKFIVDRDKYKKLRLHISNLLKDTVNFTPCGWDSDNFPVDIDKLKELWSDIVYNEFQDIMDNWVSLDLHVSWIPWYKKAKLRSALQYKVRPPVLDLDLFFKKCPGVVQSYTKLDLDMVLNYINYQLEIAVKCSDIEKINRYESLLKKAESIFNDFSESDIYSWLQFLSKWVTDTRVYGIWKNLRRYLLDPDYEILVVEEVCPICNGVFTDTSIKTKYCNVDYVLIQERSKYFVYNLKIPPPISLEVDR